LKNGNKKEKEKMTDKIKAAISNIEKTWGKGHIVNLQEKDLSVERCSSGSIALDIALGGGYPYGRIIEAYGQESSGKTTIGIHGMVEAQRSNPDKYVAFIDSEYSFDPVYAENLGLNLSSDKFIYAQPEHGEQAFSIVEELLKSGDVCFIIVDSVAAMVPKAELEGEMGESKMGLHARLMSQGMRKLTGLISKTKCILYFTNQLRQNIGVIYGDPNVTTGGNALKFYASQRLDIRKSTQEKDGDEIIGNLVKVKVSKNKVAPPFKTAEVFVEYGFGLSEEAELLKLGVESQEIKKAGSWYSYGDKKIGQGASSVIQLLKDNLEFKGELKTKIKELYNIY
jgi:recombination protein RecA